MSVSGYFRVTQCAKGWEFYQNEPLFWVKMASVAVLGSLSSLVPTIILFRRDQTQQEQKHQSPPLLDAIIDWSTIVLNVELLPLAIISPMTTLTARGVFYVYHFPWAFLVPLFYVVSLGGAGFQYRSEAFELMQQQQGALSLPPPDSSSDNECKQTIEIDSL
jgi:hypothetical protein